MKKTVGTMLDILIGLLAIGVIAFILVMAVGAALERFAPSEQEVQCTSIVGAKWSGESCYKNGVKINFND